MYLILQMRKQTQRQIKVTCSRSNTWFQSPLLLWFNILKLDHHLFRVFRSQPKVLFFPFVMSQHRQSVNYAVLIFYLIIGWNQMDNSELNLTSLGRLYFPGRLSHLIGKQHSEAQKDLSKTWQSKFKYLGINLILVT